MKYIGIDLHSNKFTCCYLSSEGETMMYTFNLTDDDLELFYNSLTKEDYVAVEVSTNTFRFTDLFEDKVKQVYIIDPLRFSIIHNTSKKTDKIDASNF